MVFSVYLEETFLISKSKGTPFGDSITKLGIEAISYNLLISTLNRLKTIDFLLNRFL